METKGVIERRFIALPGGVQVEERADGKAVIKGRAVVFGQRSEDFGGFVEVIEPGALAEADMDDVRALFNHDSNRLLGRTSSQTLRLVRSDAGLDYEIDPPDTRDAADLRTLIARRDITGSSFSFTLPSRGGWSIEELDDGSLIRHIQKIERLYDVGPVTFPAYPQTEAFSRGLEPARGQVELHREHRKHERADADKAKRLRDLAFAEAEARLRGI